MPLFSDKILINHFWKRDKLAYLVLAVFAVAMIFISTTSPSTLSRPLEAPPPQYSGVKFPSNYRTQLTQYATVQRPDGTTRNLYINPEAIAFIQ